LRRLHVSSESFDVFGIENPLIDLLVSVPDLLLKDLGVEKDKMYLVDLPRLQSILRALGDRAIHPEPGGSCANTLLGIAQLGARTAYCGKAGRDDYGRVYIRKLEEAGVTSFVGTDGHNTGSTVILVTPDAARTMNTYLGACQELKPADVPIDALRRSKRLYMTGYLWDTEGQQQAAWLALLTAQEARIPVAMSLSDPFCVTRHQTLFPSLLRDHVDLVFANRDEALMLTGRADEERALADLRGLCASVVITLGARGAVAAEGGDTVHIPPFPVQAVDTTGAGDAFAAGFLFGKARGYPLERCGRLGAAFASRVIEQIGPRLKGDVRTQLRGLLGSEP
jgi:sugar/nucleoside kinase (ribokinase family)